MEKIPREFSHPDKHSVPESSQRPVAEQAPREISPEHLAELREHIAYVFDHIGRKGMDLHLQYLQYTQGEHKDSENAPLLEAEIKIAEEFIAKAVAAREKLFSALRTATATLFLVFGSPQDSKIEYGSGGYAERASAKQELERDGITKYQRSAHTNGLSEILNKGVIPFGYGRDGMRGETAAGLGAFQNLNSTQNLEVQIAGTENSPERVNRLKRFLEVHQNRQDAWRMYLGLPQAHSTFDVSEYQPTKSKEDRYYYKIKKFEELLATKNPDNSNTPAIRDWVEFIKNSSKKGTDRVVSVDREFMIMGQYTLSLGEDEQGPYLAYWDRWDLDGSLEGKDGVIGKPFEIYDRIHYNPTTYEVLRKGGSDTIAKNAK